MKIANSAGYTLYEIVIVLALIGILFLQAMPLMHRARLAHNNDVAKLELAHAIRYSQEEALRRNTPLLICAANYNVNGILNGCLTANNSNCQGWNCGMISYLDLNGNGSYSSNGRVNALHLSSGVAITVISLPSATPTLQLAIAASGLLSDNLNSHAWSFSLAQSSFNQTLTTQLTLNSYGSLCPESGC